MGTLLKISFFSYQTNRQNLSHRSSSAENGNVK
jgi:hypothetical protein